jgi:hypothetical protein
LEFKKLNLPESLENQIRQFERKLKITETLIAVASIFCGLGFSLLLLFLTDRFWNTPLWGRGAIAIAGFIAVCLGARFWLNRWIIRKRNFKDLSVMIQQKHRELGDRLLGVVELSERQGADDNISPELCEAAINKIAEKSSHIDFEQAIDRKKFKKFIIVALVLAMVLAILPLINKDAFVNAFKRWSMPLSKVERFTFVKFKDLPDSLVVPHGENFSLTCGIEEDSSWKPSMLWFSCGDGNENTVGFDNGLAKIKVPGQTQNTELNLGAGDFSTAIQIKPVYRPVLKKLYVEIQYPEYLSRADLKLEIKNSKLKILRGSKWFLSGAVSRDLLRGELLKNKKLEAVSVANANFKSNKFNADSAGEINLNWTDIYRLEPALPYKLEIGIVEDRLPGIKCSGLPFYSAILIDEALKIKVNARDDYGIKSTSGVYKAILKESGKIVKSDSFTLAKGGPDKVELSTEYLFSPQLLDIPPDSMVEFKAGAMDYCPGHKETFSRKYHIFVLSRESHMKLLQDALEALTNRLEEVSRREADSMELNNKISKLEQERLDCKMATEKILEQAEQEKANIREMQAINREGMKLLKEALRNRDFSEKDLRKWADMLEAVKQAAQQDMKQIGQDLNNASKGERRKNMEEAVKKQRELLKKMNDLLAEMLNSLNGISINNFVNRLKKEAAKEKKLTGELKDFLSSAVGMELKNMPENLKTELNDILAKHRSVEKQVRYIKEDLEGFYVHVRIKKYKQVLDEMEKEKFLESLNKISGRISQNQSVKAIEGTRDAERQLLKWAKLLQDMNNSKDGKDGDEKEGKEVSPELIIAIMRAIQEEQVIRDKTRYLEEKKESLKKEYLSKARNVSNQQRKLFNNFLLARDLYCKCPKLGELMNQAAKAMDAARSMLWQPATDKKTVGAETYVIELLSTVLDQACSQCGSCGATAMAAMMSSKGGGNTAGKLFDGKNKNVSGKEYNHEKDRKGKSDAAGGLSGDLPEEFKAAIEGYFKLREQYIKEQEK